MSKQPPRINIGSPIEARLPEGGACTALAPGVAAKYFSGNGAKGSFETRTARAICGHCPIQALCLERAINGPRVLNGKEILIPNVRGGMTATQIGHIQQWEAYDSGAGAKPHAKRPERYRAPVKQELPVLSKSGKIADLSFEERVYMIFRDAKSGRYPNLNAAIADIAALHTAEVLRAAGQFGKGRESVSTAGTHKDGRRNPRPVSV